MFYTIISNYGWGICHSPAEVGTYIDCKPVIEMRSFRSLQEAYTFGCIAFVKRRMQLGKCQPAPLPRIDEFALGSKFFDYPDMSSAYGNVGISVQILRYFAYFSATSFAILTSHIMVVSVLEQDRQPAIVLEVNSTTSAQKKIFSWYRVMVEAVSPYLLGQVCLPSDLNLVTDTCYLLPGVALQPAGQEIWGERLLLSIPDSDHTPLEVIRLLPKK